MTELDPQQKFAVNRLSLQLGLVKFALMQGTVAALLQVQLPGLMNAIEEFMGLNLPPETVLSIPDGLPAIIADALADPIVIPDTLEGLC